MHYISTTIAILILVYTGLIAISSSPIEKIDRMCAPAFQWPKKAIVAGAKLVSPKSVPEIEKSFDAGNGRCRLWIWDAVFAEDYAKARKEFEVVGKTDNEVQAAGNGGAGKGGKDGGGK